MSDLDLVILRHAHSPKAQSHDHARQLDSLGKKQASIIGQKIAAAGFEPQLVLCSDAVRTEQTWEEAGRAFHHAPEVRMQSELYEAQVSDWLEALQQVPKTAKRVLVVGHNPTCEEFVSLLLERPITFGLACAMWLRRQQRSWILVQDFIP